MYLIAENFGRENFSKFGNLLWIRQSFICQLLVILYLKRLGAGFKFAKIFFAKCSLACYLPKFSPTKIFHYMVLYGMCSCMIHVFFFSNSNCTMTILKWVFDSLDVSYKAIIIVWTQHISNLCYSLFSTPGLDPLESASFLSNYGECVVNRFHFCQVIFWCWTKYVHNLVKTGFN